MAIDELSEVSIKINEAKKCSRFISNTLQLSKNGLDQNQLPPSLILKMKEIRDEYDEEIKKLLIREQELLDTEIGEDASSWLKNHGFVFDRKTEEYRGSGSLWYKSDYLIGRISFRRNEWIIRYDDVIGRFRNIVGHDSLNREVSGTHPASVVAVILDLYKNSLNEMSDRVKEALDRVEIFNTKYTVERVHNE